MDYYFAVICCSCYLYVLRMQRPLLQVNSLTPHDLRVQFWCSSSASAQSASPSHTQSRGMHFRWGGWLLVQVNSVLVHTRLADKRKRKRQRVLMKRRKECGWDLMLGYSSGWQLTYFRLYFKKMQPCLQNIHPANAIDPPGFEVSLLQRLRQR